MPFTDVNFVCDRFDSSEGTKDSELLKMFFKLDKMEARDFFSFLSIRSFFPLSHMSYPYKYHQ